jgi:hypothetical protein
MPMTAETKNKKQMKTPKHNIVQSQSVNFAEKGEVSNLTGEQAYIEVCEMANHLAYFTRSMLTLYKASKLDTGNEAFDTAMYELFQNTDKAHDLLLAMAGECTTKTEFQFIKNNLVNSTK